MYAIPMNTLFLSAALEVVCLFQGHCCRFDVFNPDRDRMASLSYFTLVNVMRYVVPP